MSSRTRVLFVACLAVVFLAFLALAGCSGGQGTQPPAQEETTSQPPEEEQAAPGFEGDELYTPEYKPTGEEVAIIRTTKGDINVELFGEQAPIHVGNFVELAQKGFYDGTKFHRFVERFVIQGGDPQTKSLSAAEVEQAVSSGRPPLGTGGPGYVIKGEFDPSANPNKHVVGALGMARSQSPDSAGSQFYFALEPLPQLDGSYTVFGVITDGLDVMRELRVGDEIKSVDIQNAAK